MQSPHANNPLVENFSIQLSKQLEAAIRAQCDHFTKALTKEEMRDSLGAMNQARFKQIYHNNYPMCMVETIKRVKKYFTTVKIEPIQTNETSTMNIEK
ncbi:hypothetical protein BGC07_02020 [Piscirickettsia litoralis]|uniref:Uncharacterized protein n=1 Tax=Piscirickettsia litoralis TaxID=1891921 RepID=A0ABX3A603_9GAMM|nr:hypothetical protein BGC07_02020 [Piscirickettsia litoralis]